MDRELHFAVETRPSVSDVLVVWIPRLGLALLFGAIGYSKFGASSTWNALFDRIGWGTWFRYLAGGMQVGGAILLLIPRTVVLGAAAIGATLIGAIVVDIVMFRSIIAIVPGLLLVGVTFVGLRGAFSD